jgi:GNAT superfamily N-acetyltransferase
MEYVIRPLKPADEPVLWEMLYQALQTSEGAPSREVIQQPEFASYVEGWGREGDTGFLAYDPTHGDELLGAVWLRSPSGQRQQGEEPAPELAFAVKPGLRKLGLGAALLTQLIKSKPHHSVSMRASANNPAVRLYERFGFKIAHEGPGAVTMRREV